MDAIQMDATSSHQTRVKDPQVQLGVTDEQIRAELQHAGVGEIYQFVCDSRETKVKDLINRYLDNGIVWPMARNLPRPLHEYQGGNSLVAFWKYTMFVHSDNGIPVQKVVYYVFFTFVTDGDDKQITIRSNFGDFYQLKLDKTIGCTQPSEVHIKESCTSRCKETFQDKNNRHCRICRKLAAYDLFYLMPDKCLFGTIQNANILGYTKMVETVNWDEETVDEQLALVRKDQETLVAIVAALYPGGQYEQELAKFIENLEQKKKAAQQMYVQITNKYGGNISQVQQQIVAKKQEFVDARAAVEREKQQRLEQEEERINQQRLQILLLQQQKLADEIATIKNKSSLPKIKSDGSV